MPIKSFKDKITSLASGEILGETTEEKKEERISRKQNKPKKQKIEKERKRREQKEREQKKSKERKPKERKVSRESFFKRKEIINEANEEEAVEIKEPVKKETEVQNVIKEAVDGYEDVLSILNIKEEIDIDADFESKDLDYIEFSQTTPLGFDFDEVTDFISRVKYTLNKYESALKQRNKEIIILASEVKKVEKKMMEQAQAKELEKMIGGMTEEERLIEENMNLKIKINELESKILEGNDSDLIARLKSENDALRAENQMLMKSQMNSEIKLPDSELSNNIDEEKSSLPVFNVPENIEMPSFDEDEEDDFLDNLMNESEAKKKPRDSFDSMVQSIGGEYDEK